MAFDYKKEYKDLYMPKCAPVQADVPAMGYFCVRGKGNPNTCEDYKAALEILYGLSFTVKMSKMSGDTPRAILNTWCRPWKDSGGWKRTGSLPIKINIAGFR